MNLNNAEEVLLTERTNIEPLEVEHAGKLYNLLLDENLYRFIPIDPPVSLGALAARYNRLRQRISPDGQERWLNWAIRINATADYVGTIEATVMPDNTAKLAYMIFPQFWLQGYAKERCQRVINHLFKEYSVVKILSEIDTRNIASIRLVESLGFTKFAEI
jgi:[ribosomal protein S5]-alanine N-acetyltransferase